MTQFSAFVCDNKSSEFIVPVDGSILFVIDQLVIDLPLLNPRPPPIYLDPLPATITMDLSSIPTLKLPTGNVLAFLMCFPNVSIETRQVRASGNGNLTLGARETQKRQGNIDFNQANYLLSFVLSTLANSSGPTTFAGQAGTDLMEWFIFGGWTPAFESDPPPSDAGFPPGSLANITAAYTLIIQSAMKPFLSGLIDTRIVPGGYIGNQLGFTTSLVHLCISAPLFVLLAIALVVGQFRQRWEAFTLVNVAAALANSDVPQKCVDMTQFKDSEGTGERKVLKLVRSGDGQLNCAYQSIDQE